jgi:hypothetical protein
VLIIYDYFRREYYAMRLPAILITVILLASFMLPVSAQTVFGQGVYQFEDYVAQMTYSGTWATQTQMSLTVRTGTSAGASVTFLASGRYLVLWRYQRSTGISSRYNVCINASCTLVISESTNTENQWVPSSFPLAAGTNTVSITQTLGNVVLDYFMVLDDPSTAGMPTAVPTVPTATILPSSTPASTTTPQPTPTPQPTSTPQPSSTPISVIWAIDPEKSYGMANGQITAFEYSATAADSHIANLLTMLVVSVWGFFLFCVFVLVRYRK